MVASILLVSHEYLLTVPENKVVYAHEGTPVVMNCRTNSFDVNVLWKLLTKKQETRLQKISSGDQIAPNLFHIYQVNRSLLGQYDLIFTATLLTGGQYICQEGPFGHEDGNMSSAELVVLGKISY